MRFLGVFLALLSVVCGQQVESLCSKYAKTLLGTSATGDEFLLIELLVNTAFFGNYTGKNSNTTPANKNFPGSSISVPGVLARGKVQGTTVNLRPYFDGSLVSTNRDGRATSVNFLDGARAPILHGNLFKSGSPGSKPGRMLFNDLYLYFGSLFGCKGGKAGFPEYLGDHSMFNVHRYMDVSDAEFTWFVEQFGLAAASFSFTARDTTTIIRALIENFGSKCLRPVAIPSTSRPELQSICVGSGCTKAPDGDCSLYPAVEEPKKAGGGGGGGGSSSSHSTSRHAGHSHTSHHPAHTHTGTSGGGQSSGGGGTPGGGSSGGGGGGLSTGAIAGIAVAGVLGAIALAAGAFLLGRRGVRRSAAGGGKLGPADDEPSEATPDMSESETATTAAEAQAAHELPSGVDDVRLEMPTTRGPFELEEERAFELPSTVSREGSRAARS